MECMKVTFFPVDSLYDKSQPQFYIILRIFPGKSEKTRKYFFGFYLPVCTRTYSKNMKIWHFWCNMMKKWYGFGHVLQRSDEGTGRMGKARI